MHDTSYQTPASPFAMLAKVTLERLIYLALLATTLAKLFCPIFELLKPLFTDRRSDVN